jgi:hypothetical protein
VWLDLETDIAAEFSDMRVDARACGLSIRRVAEDTPERRAYKAAKQREYDRAKRAPEGRKQPSWTERRAQARKEARRKREEVREFARALLASGMTGRAVAARLGVAQQTISLWKKVS